MAVVEVEPDTELIVGLIIRGIKNTIIIYNDGLGDMDTST
jgi:hypothetical protein